jgi:hypothetical protein
MVLVFSSYIHGKFATFVDGRKCSMLISWEIKLVTCAPLLETVAHKLCFPKTTHEDN